MVQKPFIKEKIRENRLIFNFPSRTATIASNMLRCTYILRLKPLSHLKFNQIIEKNYFQRKVQPLRKSDRKESLKQIKQGLKVGLRPYNY